MPKKNIKISDLIPDDKNYNKGNEFGNSLIEKSLRKLGAGRSILLDKNNRIITGNKTIENAGAIGLEDIQIVESDGKRIIAVKRTDIDLDSKMGREMALADNATAKANIEWDMDALNVDWSTEEQTEWGIVPSFNTEAAEDDYVIPDEIETDIVLGDLFEIGQHRLLCGDSTKAEDVARLMNGEKADMVFTDPPYNMGAGFTGTFAKSMKNTQKRLKKLIDFDPYSITHILHLDCGSYYIFTSKNLIPVYLAIFKGYNFNILFWAKTNPVPHCYKTFLPDIEYLLFFSKGGKMIWNSSLTPTSIYKKYYISEKLEGREHAGDLHPTMKPVKLIADKVKINSNNNGIVLDIFGGAGSSMVASHQLGRRGFLIDNEPKYCWVIVDRMLKLAPAIEIKKNGEAYRQNSEKAVSK